jgi:hypothetical protein
MFHTIRPGHQNAHTRPAPRAARRAWPSKRECMRKPPASARPALLVRHIPPRNRSACHYLHTRHRPYVRDTQQQTDTMGADADRNYERRCYSGERYRQPEPDLGRKEKSGESAPKHLGQLFN